MQKSIVGWDIGGAHIKAVILEPSGFFSKTYQLPCPLWKGIEYLKQSVQHIVEDLPTSHIQHIITMTGELVDLFESRDQGVKAIISVMQEMLAGRELLVYAGVDGFLTPNQVYKNHYVSIASANWLASASLVASQRSDGLFIDIGSTTTDILLFSEHKVQALGLTDYERMRSDELVYTGIVRTAVMAVAQTAFFQGKEMGLMAEYFATMADVYRLTGELDEQHDQNETADGAEKSVEASAKRLSRMTGYEYEEKDVPMWIQFALAIKSQQKNKIRQACERQLSRCVISSQGCFVGAGVGRFLVKQVASELGYPYIDFTDLFKHQDQQAGLSIADCAPAAAIAQLVSTHYISII
jgi:probable H4MPT-linked C1 transfer pathway protein